MPAFMFEKISPPVHQGGSIPAVTIREQGPGLGAWTISSPAARDLDGAALNDHQRAHVLFGHGRHGLGQAIVRLDDVQGAAFDAQDIANFHGIALFCKIFTYQST